MGVESAPKNAERYFKSMYRLGPIILLAHGLVEFSDKLIGKQQQKGISPNHVLDVILVHVQGSAKRWTLGCVK